MTVWCRSFPEYNLHQLLVWYWNKATANLLCPYVWWIKSHGNPLESTPTCMGLVILSNMQFGMSSYPGNLFIFIWLTVWIGFFFKVKRSFKREVITLFYFIFILTLLPVTYPFSKQGFSYKVNLRLGWQFIYPAQWLVYVWLYQLKGYEFKPWPCYLIYETSVRSFYIRFFQFIWFYWPNWHLSTLLKYNFNLKIIML